MKTIFQKLGGVKELLKLNEEEFSITIKRLGNWHYKKDFQLTNEEQHILEKLISHKYNPFTIYRWNLLANAPDEVKYQLQQGLVGQKKASKKKQEYKKQYQPEEANLHRDVIDLAERYIVR